MSWEFQGVLVFEFGAVESFSAEVRFLFCNRSLLAGGYAVYGDVCRLDHIIGYDD